MEGEDRNTHSLAQYYTSASRSGRTQRTSMPSGTWSTQSISNFPPLLGAATNMSNLPGNLNGSALDLMVPSVAANSDPNTIASSSVLNFLAYSSSADSKYLSTSKKVKNSLLGNSLNKTTSGVMTRGMRLKQMSEETPHRPRLFEFFMGLPAEIRNRIFGYFFGISGGDARPIYELAPSFEWDVNSNSILVPRFLGRRGRVLEINPRSQNILFVNKQIAVEAQYFLYSNFRWVLEQDQAVAFQRTFCRNIGSNTASIRTLQMDIPNCLKVQPGRFIPEYVGFIINTLCNLTTLVLTTEFYLVYKPRRWMEEHRGLLYTAASIIVSHKTLRSAIWTETGKPRNIHCPYDNPGLRQTHLRATLTESVITGETRGENRGLVLDCPAIVNAGWIALQQSWEARDWSINKNTPDEIVGGGFGEVGQQPKDLEDETQQGSLTTIHEWMEWGQP